MTTCSFEMRTTEYIPLITVAVVSYNHGQTIKQCFDSIINQTRCRIDLVVVDDGSCDFKKEVVEQYLRNCGSEVVESISVEAFEENHGPAEAYRKALEMAKGEYILFLGGDDYLASCSVLTEMSKHLRSEIVDVLQAQGKLIDAEQEILLPDEGDISLLENREYAALYQSFVNEGFPNVFCIQSAFFRTSWLRSLTVFTEEFLYAVDWNVYLQMISCKARFKYTPQIATNMYGGGAYRECEFATLYIYKAYLHEASRAIRMYALKDCALLDTDVRLITHIAERMEHKADVGVEWNYLAFEDKVAWCKANREFVKTASSIKKAEMKTTFTIDSIVACVFAVFLILSFMGIVPAGIIKVAFALFMITYMCIVFCQCLWQIKSSNLSKYGSVCIYQILLCLFVVLIKNGSVGSVNAIWLLIPVGVTLVIAIIICLTIANKFIKWIRNRC